MTIGQIISIYSTDSLIKAISEKQEHTFLKGLKGSQAAVITAAVASIKERDILIVSKDKETAAYFGDDLQNLLPNQEVLLFPSSYKRPYEVTDTDNANILLRTETLNRLLADDRNARLIVTWPDALCERVVNKKALKSHTFSAKVGEQINSEFISELLTTYHFERTDFVYEPGQFAVRGGIIDIYSYGQQYPYRLEMFGDEIEEIRTFDPIDQLSIEKLSQISIIPNTQHQLVEEKRDSFLSYLNKGALILAEDSDLIIETVDKTYHKAREEFQEMMDKAGGTQVVLNPKELFESGESIKEKLLEKTILQYGNRDFPFSSTVTIEFNSSAQPPFNRNFDLFLEDINKQVARGFTCIITAEASSQLQRLESILMEAAPDLEVDLMLLSISHGFRDEDRKLAVYTDHEVFEKFHRYKSRDRISKSKALTLKELRSLQTGDYVTHIDHGVGRFAGMEQVENGNKKQEAVRLIYRDDDILLVSVHSLHKIAKYTGKEGQVPSMNKLGSAEWDNKKKRAKRRLKDIARDLIELYAKRRECEGFAFQQDSYMQAELESSFMYEDTPDQAKATLDVKHDMMKSHPMDRLVCGDVGFGKTEVAIRAAFKAILGGKQVAVLVPTTILAMQHYRTFSQRLKDMPVRISYINRFKSTKEINQTLLELKEGKLDIIIGTHRLVSKDVAFKDLGLLVIDEEQKFGVKVKDRLKEFRVNVDVLTLTATPIPRTLHFSLMGARDLSIISTPPPNRQPVNTEIHSFNENIIRDAISFEIDRNGQVFFVNNRIADIELIAGMIKRLVPGAKVATAHGQMEGSKLEKIMLAFIGGEYDVLVSTNIIESGLDIPNANTIMINHAHMFGLSDLHQMRGRVGRSNVKAYCYLLTPSLAGLTPDARKRLSTLEEFTDLGDGFKVAMRDLDIRGAGDLLGAEQSGFINDLGFDTYHKMLDEAVQELRENEFKALFEKTDEQSSKLTKEFVRETTIETDLELLIPEVYVKSINERLSLYSRLDNIEDESELESFKTELQDRFGPVPEETMHLMDSVRLRREAKRVGFERLTIKNGSMKAYLVGESNEEYFNSPLFSSILSYVKSHPGKTQMKELKGKPIVTFKDIKSIPEARGIMHDILDKYSQLFEVG